VRRCPGGGGEGRKVREETQGKLAGERLEKNVTYQLNGHRGLRGKKTDVAEIDERTGITNHATAAAFPSKQAAVEDSKGETGRLYQSSAEIAKTPCHNATCLTQGSPQAQG
jgi:hypothetical protein